MSDPNDLDASWNNSNSATDPSVDELDKSWSEPDANSKANESPVSDDAKTDTSWSDVAHGMVNNMVPSAIGIAKGIGSAIIHPVDTYHAFGSLIDGVQSKVDNLAGVQQSPEVQAKREAAVNALGSMYAQRYGSMEGFKHALATDPAAVLMDLSTIATGGESALGAAAGAADKVGALADVASAARTGANAAGTVAKYTNPLDPAGIVSNKLGQMLKPTVPTAVDADAALARTGSGKITSADFDAAGVPDVLADTLKTKGANEASSAEAIIKAAGGDASNSMVTGIRATDPGPMKVHEDIAAANGPKFAANMQDISGAPIADPAAIPRALDQAAVAQINNYKSLYDKAFAQPGALSWKAGGAPLLNSIDSELSNYPGVAKIADMGDFPNTYDQSIGAINDIKKYMPGVAGGKPLTGQRLAAIRTEMNSRFEDASGTDRIALRGIIDGFDNHIVQAASNQTPAKLASGVVSPANSNSLWQGGDGLQFASDYNAARNAFKSYHNTFTNPAGGNDVIASISKKLGPQRQIDPATGAALPVNDDAAYMAVNPAKPLLDPQKGPQLYNRLTSAAGEPAVKTYVRQSILAQDPVKGTLANKPEQIENLRLSPIGQNVFTPAEHAKIKINSEARSLSDAKPKPSQRLAQLKKMVQNASHHGSDRFIGAMLGEQAGGLMGGIAGAAAAPLVEAGIHKALGHVGEGKMAAGAPMPSAFKRGLQAVGSQAPKLVTPRTAQLAQAAQSQRQGHAKGGSVSEEAHHRRLVNRLMKLAEEAGKRTEEETEPLLKAPDAVITKALHLAQKVI